MPVPGLRIPGARPSAYSIGRSLRFRSGSTAYLSRTFAAGNRRLYTFSCWCKRGALNGAIQDLFSTTESGNGRNFGFNGSDQIFSDLHSGGTLTSTAVFRDVSSWYHIMIRVDTAQATSTDRTQIYVNGQLLSLTGTYPTQNSDTGVNQAIAHRIGGGSVGGFPYPLDGYLADVIFVDGQSLGPSAFGQTDPTTGAWVPRKYGGSYGTTGFYLPFSDTTSTTTIVQDSSGLGNNWTATNISLTAGVTYDSSLDTPSANWTVLNPLQNINNGVPFNGNMSTSATFNTTPSLLGTTVAARTGKWYFEYSPSLSGSFGYVGIIDTGQSIGTNVYVGGPTGSVGLELGSGIVFSSNASAGTITTGSLTAGAVGMIALDLDNGRIFFGENGTWENSGDPAAGTNPRVTGLTGEKMWAMSNYTGNGTIDCNFGQRPFTYTPPSGFIGMNTAALPNPTIRRGDDRFQAVIYTGTGSSLGVTGFNFQPDLVWIKSRSAATDSALYDAARGTQTRLESNTIDAEAATDAGLTAFNSNGFTVSTLAQVNTNTATYVAWGWDEANAVAGLDIVTYSGSLSAVGTANVSHNLGVVPAMIISKSRNVAGLDNGQWVVRHTRLTSANHYLALNRTDAEINSSANGSMSAATSTTFPTNYTSGMNVTGNNYVAYVFAEVPGFSRFGSYLGNGASDGTFVWCGFRPRFVMIKRIDSTSDWNIRDGARNPSNVNDNPLWPNLPNAESADPSHNIDLLSNGFKVRASSAWINANNGTFVFAAFAEVPFKYANAR